MTSVSLSPAAARRVRLIAERQGHADARLRLTVDGGGCAGFNYRFALADGFADDDHRFATDGVELVVDETSLSFVAGAVVDYVQSLAGAAFTVTNPNARSSCGCGTSFSL